MIKKNSLKKGKKSMNLLVGRNAYTDYNNIFNLNHNQYSLKDKIATSSNINNNNIRSLFESPIHTKKSLFFDSSNPLGLSDQTQTQTHTQPRIYPSPRLNSTNSTDFSNIKIKNANRMLRKLRKTILKIKNKNNKRINELKIDIPKNLIIKNDYPINAVKNKTNEKNQGHIDKFSKTLPKFEFNKNKFNLNENEKNKNKYKELRFKVHKTIKSNIHPLCTNFINKAHLFNEKILEYYQSDHYINLIRIFQNKLHYKLNLENYPKIKMYTDIKSLEKVSKTNKLDFRKCFSEKEQKLILLDPAYYFQKDNPDSFINVNITKQKSLADRIQEEDEEHQIKQILNTYMNKKNKNKKKSRNIKIGYDYTDSKKKLISKVNRILDYNKKNNLNSKKLENLDLNNLSAEDNKEEIDEFKKDEKYDFFKAYKTYVKEAYKNAEILNKIEEEKVKKKKNFLFNVDHKLRNCVIQLDAISKDKLLQKKAKENLYYDKAKDEKNKFNIVTRQMLVEQNYEYLSKLGRKIMGMNKIERKKNKENSEENKDERNKDEKSENNDKSKKSIKKEKSNDMNDNREKKLINLHLNKIKLIYKQQ